MSGYTFAGSVIDPSKDPNATSGPHVDIRIIPRYGENSGQRIDPALRPGLLNRVFVGSGDNRRSLTSYPLTSPYGPRDTGIPGASKFHKGHDYGVDVGEELYVLGGTNYRTDGSAGLISVEDDAGNPYDFEFYHTALAPGSPEQAITPQRVEAKTRAKSYSEMSGAEINAKYDELRGGDIAVAETEGMKMHKAIFGKP